MCFARTYMTFLKFLRLEKIENIKGYKNKSGTVNSGKAKSH